MDIDDKIRVAKRNGKFTIEMIQEDFDEGSKKFFEQNGFEFAPDKTFGGVKIVIK